MSLGGRFSLKGQYSSNHIVPGTVFWMTQENILALGGNLYKILEKTIWVKPYYPRYKFLNKLLSTKYYIRFKWTLV